MAANFEVFLASGCSISLPMVVDVFEPLSDKQVIEEIRVYPDWLLDHKLSHEIDRNEIELYVCAGNIVRIAGTIGSAPFGILSYYESSMFIYTLWLDTVYDITLDADKITDENRIVYKKIAGKLLTSAYDRIVCMALGCELDVTYQEDLKLMVETASNVVCWILPDCGKEMCLGAYSYKPVLNHKAIYAKVG